MSVRDDVERKLREALAPTRLEIRDESAAHAGHGASGAHLRVVVVSAAFAGKAPLARHRLVNAALKAELDSGAVHALQLTLRAPDEEGA